jgi:hypothetical protein
MEHVLTEKIDKKTLMEVVRRVVEAFLSSNPRVGFTKVGGEEKQTFFIEYDPIGVVPVVLLLRVDRILLGILHLPSGCSGTLLPESVQEIHFPNRPGRAVHKGDLSVRWPKLLFN